MAGTSPAMTQKRMVYRSIIISKELNVLPAAQSSQRPFFGACTGQSPDPRLVGGKFLGRP